jgi:hypothetical protein
MNGFPTGSGRPKALATLCAALLALAGCGGGEHEADNAAEGAAPTLAKLPISINAVMVSSVSEPSEFLFAIGNGDLPKDDADWDQLKYHAYQMVLAGQTIQLPGQGEKDLEWVTDPQWRKLADDLTQIGFKALQLAQAHDADRAKWQEIGNALVDRCQSCHMKFKPDVPTDNIFYRGGKRLSVGESVFQH